jgi:hypothetical protein
MQVCPECGDAHLEQLADKSYMECGNGHRFRLVRVMSCVNCGKYAVLNPNGICDECIDQLG